MLNWVWHVSHLLGVGSELVDEIQTLIARGEVPVGSFVAPSHQALTREDACLDPTEWARPKPVSEESPFGGFKIELQQSIICDDNPGLSVGRQG